MSAKPLKGYSRNESQIWGFHILVKLQEGSFQLKRELSFYEVLTRPSVCKISMVTLFLHLLTFSNMFWFFLLTHLKWLLSFWVELWLEMVQNNWSFSFQFSCSLSSLKNHEEQYALRHKIFRKHQSIDAFPFISLFRYTNTLLKQQMKIYFWRKSLSVQLVIKVFWETAYRSSFVIA